MSNAIVGTGTEFQRFNGHSWETIADIVSVDGPILTRSMIDVTSLTSEGGFAEYIGGVMDGGSIKLEMQFTQHNYSMMKVDFLNKYPISYRIILPDVLSSTISFNGLVKDLPINIPLDGVIMCSVGIKVTGMVFDSFTDESDVVPPESTDIPESSDVVLPESSDVIPESSDIFVPESSDLFIPESSDAIPPESSDINLIPPTAGVIAIIAPTIISATVSDIDLRCAYVEVQYKVHTDSTWIKSTTEIDKTDHKVYLFGLLPGTNYDVRFKCKGFNTIPDSVYSSTITETTSDYAGTIYYIDPSAGTNGSGTIGSPFNGSTFDQQYGQAWASNSIYLIKRGTTWNRTWTINILSKSNVTLAAYGTGDKPKITIGTTDNTNSLMDLGSSYNIRLCNLDMYGRNYNRATEVGPLCIIKMNGTSGTGSNTTDILNCDIHHANYGIRGVQDVDSVRVLGGTIHTILDDGVFYQGATNCEFGYLNVYNVNEKWFQGMNQVHAGGDCIQVDGHIIGLDGLYIHHCILDHQSTGLKFCLIYESVKLGDVITIEYCHFLREDMSANDSEQGIYAAGQAGATHTLYFRHNIISNATAIAYWDTLGHVNSEFIDNIFINTDRALELYSTSGVKIYNNTFVNARMCIEHENHATGVEIKNNIFDIEIGQLVYNFHAGAVTPAGITIDYNCYSREVTNMFTQYLTGYSTLAAWRIFTGQETHSFVADPKLNVDYSLQWNSPCQGTGQVIAGYTPTSNVDMGAFDGINYEESFFN
jgi:predicted secreted protein